MYNKVKADSWVPQLEKVLEKAWLKWADLGPLRASHQRLNHDHLMEK